MKHRPISLLLTALLGGYATSAAASLPAAGEDYISLQLASGDRQALEKHYRQNANLPFLRIEQRGKLHVLRAGFWPDMQQARAALRGQPQEHGLLRSASFRPESIVRSNWDATPAAAAATSTLPPAAAPAGQPVAPPAPPPDTAPTRTPAASSPNTARAKPPADRPGAENTTPDNLQPFNHEDYLLAYGILLANGDQQQAFRIAHKAVANVPENHEWRRKLAQVAEWTRRPTIAWENWKYLFDHGDRSDATFKALLRLSALSDSPDTLLEIWRLRATRKTPTPAEFGEIAELYEQASKPQEGALYFEAQYRRLQDPLLLEHAASLAEHGGDDERALRLYGERIARQPFPLATVLRTAVLLMRKDRTTEAHALLQAQRVHVPAEMTEFWRLLGNTAWELGELASAEQAYKHYATSQTASAADWSRLIFLVRQHHPEQAADLALDAYRRFDNPDYLLLALSIQDERGNLPAQQRIHQGLTAAQLGALRLAPQYAQFLVLRARYHQARRALDPAWADLSAALKLDGNNAEVGAAAIWFLIDTRRVDALRELLARLAPRAEQEAAYWLPFASAQHALDRYREAAHWYRKQIRRQPDDLLLLLNYADALDRLQQGGMAERIRRHAWIQLRKLHPQPNLTPPLGNQPDLLALARLALLNQPGDPGLELVRKVANRLRGLEESHDEQGDDQQTNDLILGWAINKENFPNARSWLWLRYARQLAARTAAAPQRNVLPAGDDKAKRSQAPLWGASQSALQLNDTETMAQLLEKQAAGLPIYNRYDTAYALEHWPQALDIGFRGLEASDVDDDLYDRYRIHAPQHANYLQFGASRDLFGPLRGHTGTLDARLSADRKLQVLLGWSKLRQRSDTAEFAPLVRNTEQLTNLGLRWLGNRSSTEFALFRRNELAANTGWRLQHNWSESQRLALDATLARRDASSESVPLRVAGGEDSLRLNLSYTLGKREDIRITPRWAVYRSQFGETLGHGKSLEIEAGYRFRTEYPDWRARVFVNRQLLTADGNPAARTLAELAPAVQTEIATGAVDAARYFIPESNSSAGLCVSMGENIAGQSLQDTYSRAWRPFFDACRTASRLNGAGYSATLGAAGALDGEDHLRIQLEQNLGGTSNGNAGIPATGALTRQFSIRYRHYF